MQAPMTSNRKIAANRRNSRKARGPRTAAGKSDASRNALRHGLAAITHREPLPSIEIEEFARALCGDDTDPAVFAQAVRIAENEMQLRAIRTQQVAVIERLREPYLVPFVKKDNSLQLGLARFMEGWLAEWEIEARLPKLLEKYKDQMLPLLEHDNNYPNCLRDIGDLYTILEEPDYIDEQTREQARKRLKNRELVEQRGEYEALRAAIDDLIRLDRYQRRAWSRQKQAIRQFVALHVCRNGQIWAT
jgi:hypothetical protein